MPIDFSGWKSCKLAEAKGDRLLDYFTYEKFALHDMPLDRFTGVTLMVLQPPVAKPVDLRIGRIEVLKEIGGSLANLRIEVNGSDCAIPAKLKPDQSLETGDLWASLDSRALRISNARGRQLHRITLPAPAPTIPGREAASASPPPESLWSTAKQMRWIDRNDNIACPTAWGRLS